MLLYLFTHFLRERTLIAIADGLGHLGLKPAPAAYEYLATFCQDVPLPREESAAELDYTHMVYASDAQSFPGLLLSMLSVSRSLASPESCTFHLVVPEEDATQASELLRCYRRELYDLKVLPQVEVHTAKVLDFADTKTLASDWAAWVRIYLHLYLPHAPRAIYLEPDTLVTSDLGRLYRMAMRYAVAASWDLPPAYSPCLQEHPVLPKGDPSWVFNSGVLLFDLRRWASSGLANETERWRRESQGCGGDQLAMNIAIKGDFDRLPWAWHVQWLGSPNWLALPQPCLGEGHIFHWTGGDSSAKPWLDTRNKAMDYMVKQYAPCKACAALPAGLPSLCGGPRQRASVKLVWPASDTVAVTDQSGTGAAARDGLAAGMRMAEL